MSEQLPQTRCQAVQWPGVESAACLLQGQLSIHPAFESLEHPTYERIHSTSVKGHLMNKVN